MKCLRCGKPIDETEAKIIEEAGVDPFCSEYCELVYGGVSLPYSQGDDFVIDVINGDYFKRKGYVVENGRWVKLG